MTSVHLSYWVFTLIVWWYIKHLSTFCSSSECKIQTISNFNIFTYTLKSLLIKRLDDKARLKTVNILIAIKNFNIKNVLRLPVQLIYICNQMRIHKNEYYVYTAIVLDVYSIISYSNKSISSTLVSSFTANYT